MQWGAARNAANHGTDNTMTTNTTTRTRTPKPATRASRKPAAAAASPLDTIITLARTVTPANIIDVVGRACRNHGVTARNVGRYTGMRVMAFQNHTMVRNAEWQLDDCQLLAVWTMEFPAAVGRVFAVNGRMNNGAVTATDVANGIGIVRGVRSDYNRTGHGDPNGKPATPAESYGAKRFDVAPAAPVVTPAPVTATATRKPRTRKPAAA